MLRPLVDFIGGLSIRGWRPFRQSAIFLLLLLVLVGLAAFVVLAVPPVIRDLPPFALELPSRLPEIQAKLQEIPFADQIDTAGLISQAQGAIGQGATFLFLSLKDWAGTVFTLAMGIILTVYFTLEGESALPVGRSHSFPRQNRTRLDLALRRAQTRMGRWLLGQGARSC